MKRLLSLLLLLCLPCWGEQTVVALEGSRIRAGDLAIVIGEPSAPGLDLGPAPAPGVRRRVTRVQLERWARRCGAAAEELPDEILLLRKMRPWPEEEAAETLHRLLAQETKAAVEVELVGFSQGDVPAGELEWRLLGTPRFSGRPARLSLSWRDPGGRSGVESVTAAVRLQVEALVARRDLPAGTELQRGDLQLTAVNLTDLRQQYLVDLKQDTRWTLRKPLKSGEALSAAALEERPDVERGAIVELVVALGAVRLRAPARAEGAGSAGDLIPFRNLATNQRVLARVADPKTAEVVTR